MKKHVAGIIPVAGLKSDFDLPWHPSLMPIAPNYLAVERAVAECAYAGCNTIWVVCNDDVTPLVRHQVGEKVRTQCMITVILSTTRKILNGQ